MRSPRGAGRSLFAPLSRGEPAGLYLHVPFCSAICPYCDFAVARGAKEDRERFTGVLEREIRRWSVDGAVFDSVYLGGGTPSYLGPEQLRRVLEAVRDTLPLHQDAVFVLEANPEDVSPPRARLWQELGIAGVSLGVQSFRRQALRFLGRRHTPQEASDSVEVLLAAGFEWVSLDLIYGLPSAVDPSPRAFVADIEAAARLRPHHISCYQLGVTADTPFGRLRARGALRELGDEAQAEAFLAVHSALAERGYAAYEVSNFARGAEHRSRHNPKYWRHAPYLGLGPSAHSFDGRERWWSTRDWKRWASQVEAEASTESGRERLTGAQLALECLLLRLRTVDGIDLGKLSERLGLDLVDRNRRLIEHLVASGKLTQDGDRLRPTTHGLAVADGLAAAFDLD